MMGQRGTYRQRMPTCFGPAPSPRQDANGAPWSNPIARITSIAASFLTDPEALRPLLPEGGVLLGEPVVTVEFMYIRELQWLAGRGYNTLGVRFPIAVAENKRRVEGRFLAVLWENLADPILTGREELGFAKLYCELPPASSFDDTTECRASWDGHGFCHLSLREAENAAISPSQDDGLLHFASMPSIGVTGQTAYQGWALTPPSPVVEVLSHQIGNADVRFVRSSWEQLPTLAHIVNCLAALPVIAPRGGTITELRSDTSLHNHRLLSQEAGA